MEAVQSYLETVQSNLETVQSNLKTVQTNFFERLYFSEKKIKIKNKDNKISHGRGNSLKNKVRSWVELDSPDPLKPLPLQTIKSIAHVNLQNDPSVAAIHGITSGRKLIGIGQTNWNCFVKCAK